MTGYIKFYRKTWNSAVYSDPYMLKLWIHCLMKATHTEHDQLVGRQVVKLQPGEFVTGRDALSEEFNRGARTKDIVKPRTLWRWLKLLEELQMLSIKSETKYSVVAVTNWIDYQQSDQQVSNKRPADDQQMSTNKNVKNDKNEKKSNSPKQAYDETSPYFILSDFMHKEILKNNANYKQPNIQSWSNTFRLLIERDKRDISEVSKLIRWVQQDDFEMVNVLSPTKLRARYDNLAMKMKQPKFGEKKKVEVKPSTSVDAGDMLEGMEW